MPSSVATFVPSKRYVRQQSIFSADLGVPLWKPAKATLCTPGSPKVSPNAYGWKTKITCSFHIVPKAQSLPRTACIPCFSSPACGIAYMPGVYFMACIPCLISPACLPACLPACVQSRVPVIGCLFHEGHSVFQFAGRNGAYGMCTNYVHI